MPVRVKQIRIAEIPSAFCSAPYRETPVRFEKIRTAEIPSAFPVGYRETPVRLAKMRVPYN